MNRLIRPMTQEERERAKEKQQMNTGSMKTEIALYNAMLRNKLTLKEAIDAMDNHANDKDFQKHLDDYYSSELYIADDFESVTPDF